MNLWEKQAPSRVQKPAANIDADAPKPVKKPAKKAAKK